MATTQRTVTADELAVLAARDAGRLRYELIAGELEVMSPAKPRHGRVIGRLTSSLGPHVLARGLGEIFGAETGFMLARNPDTIRAPDVAYVRREQVLAVGDTDDWWPGAPDLAVEVLSPEDSYSKTREKVALWLGAGARLVLVVDPRRRIVEVHRPGMSPLELTEADAIDRGDVVPGWSLPVARLFAPVGEVDET
jgi:Uma2 family endonuclease